MAGLERRSSMGVDRRVSAPSSILPQRTSVHFDEEEEDNDDDDYDLQAMGISDGYRPSGPTPGPNRMSSRASQRLSYGRRTPPPRPSSTTKPQALDTFALQHDGGMGPIQGRSSTTASNVNTAAPTRSSSVSTDMPYIRPESPYRGPSGPSHPYQMYPQESRLARTASVATTSTMPVLDRPYNGPGGPTHPYGMYPQNTVPETEIAVQPCPLAPVPVGFPGLNNNYQRRLGPDGEEIADIIGPDGHTEQLPPYTQYPDEAFARKTRPTVTIPVAGAGGMGLATRNPEFASREDLDSPSRESTRTATSSTSEHPVNLAAVQLSEKPELKRWQKIARKRVWGIVPLWVMILVALVFTMFGIILGIVFAVLKATHSNNKQRPGEDPQSPVATTMTTTFDAVPLSAFPTGLPDLPTGTFALPISAPSSIQNSCLSNTQQSAAWSCSITSTSYTITVKPLLGSNSDLANNEVSLGLGNYTFGNHYTYGTQPPVLTQDQVLNLVTDSQEPEKGPAWFFEMPYNKVVILPEMAINSPIPNNKRGNVEKKGEPLPLLPVGFMRKNVVHPGEKPWFCYWNGTLLEGFIYVNLTSSTGRSASPSPASVSATVTSTYSSSIPSGSAALSPGSSDSGPTDRFKGLPPAYPNVLKIEERRVPSPQTISPYCVQHIIDDDGTASIARNSTGQSVVVFLNETDSSSIVSRLEAERRYGELNPTLSRRGLNSAACGCVWLWT